MNDFDVVIIGGGPAGMMAAATASFFCGRVALIEKNKSLGKKLLLTGNGRCNITNNKRNIKDLASVYGKEAKALISAFSVFGPKETITFFNKYGLETKEENGRIFPKSDKSLDVLNLFLNIFKNQKVKIFLDSKIEKIRVNKERIDSIILSNGNIIKGKNYILCTGGKSYPKTGSFGEGITLASDLGHLIKKPRPILSPIETKEKWMGKIEGVSLKDIKITLVCDNKSKKIVFGDIVFTKFGLSGPLILDLSREIDSCLQKNSKVSLLLDLYPKLDIIAFEKKLLKRIDKFPRKNIASLFLKEVPKSILPILLSFVSISKERKAFSLTKKERILICKTFKNIKIRVKNIMGFDFAMATRGGVLLSQIDARTMKSKLIHNLYFAGEIMNVDGPCGGYNLQICWTTGYVAGKNASY